MLNDLQDAGDLRTKKELLDNAFTLLKWAVRQKREGRIIISVDPKSGSSKELEFPYLQRAQEKRELALASSDIAVPAGRVVSLS